MSNKYERGLEVSSVLHLQGSREVHSSLSFVLRKLGVDANMRIPNSDYPDAEINGTIMVHYGLPVYDAQAGSLVVLSRILTNGYFRANNNEQLPLLSFEDVWIARIIKLVESIPYDKLPEDAFKNVIGAVKNLEDLHLLILKRYTQSLPDKSDNQILTQGVSIRYIELIKRISLSKIQ